MTRVNRRFRIGMMGKIMLAFLTVLCIPFIYAATLVYQNSVASVVTEVNEAFEAGLAMKAAAVTRKLENMRAAGSKITHNKVLMDYFSGENLDKPDTLEKLHKTIYPILNWTNEINANSYTIRFFTENSNIYENTSIYHINSLEAQGVYGAVRTAAFQSPFVETFHSQRVYKYEVGRETGLYKEFSLYFPMVQKYCYGVNTYVELALTADELFKDFVPDASLLTGAFLVVTDGGSVVYEINNNISGAAAEAALTFTAGSNGNTEFVNEGIHYTVRTHSFPSYGFNIIEVHEIEKIMRDSLRTKFLFFITLSATVAALLFAVYMLSRLLTVRIKALASVMRQVQSGNLDAHVYVNGNDELSDLADGLNTMLKQINHMIASEYATKLLQKEMMLKNLQGQINPHFFYNTLESIRMLAETKSEQEISDLLASLGHITRYGFAEEEDVPLSKELSHICSYCELQNLIMNGRLRLECGIDRALYGYTIPKLILQPIVENAILHGFKNKMGSCVITVRSALTSEHLKIEIEDNGNGLSQDETALLNKNIRVEPAGRDADPGRKMGLRNVHRRLCIRYGENYGILAEPCQGGGLRVIIALPGV